MRLAVRLALRLALTLSVRVGESGGQILGENKLLTQESQRVPGHVEHPRQADVLKALSTPAPKPQGENGVRSS
jgi:hypothetical protein